MKLEALKWGVSMDPVWQVWQGKTARLAKAECILENLAGEFKLPLWRLKKQTKKTLLRIISKNLKWIHLICFLGWATTPETRMQFDFGRETPPSSFPLTFRGGERSRVSAASRHPIRRVSQWGCAAENCNFINTEGIWVRTRGGNVTVAGGIKAPCES